MTTSQDSSRKFSLEMKSEVHYKKAAKSYRKSKQYIKLNQSNMQILNGKNLERLTKIYLRIYYLMIFL